MKKNEEKSLRKDRRAMIKEKGDKLLESIDKRKIPVEVVEEFTHIEFEDVKLDLREYRNWINQLNSEHSLNESEISVIIGVFKNASLASYKKGLIKISDLYCYNYRLFTRKLYFKQRLYHLWILYEIWGNLSKFGTSIFRFFMSIFSIIFFFALLFFSLSDKGLYYSGASSYVDLFFKCLYWSFVTFSTLGYGDITPASTFTKMLASVEAFIGLIMIGIFLDLITKYHEFRKVV
jgi:hypothetical protein